MTLTDQQPSDGSVFKIVRMGQLGVYLNTASDEKVDGVRQNIHILEPLSAGANIKHVIFAEPHQMKGTASVALEEICVKLNYSQFRVITRFYEKLERIRRSAQFQQFRPKVPVTQNTKAWWYFAFRTVVKQYHIDEKVKLFNRTYIQGLDINLH